MIDIGNTLAKSALFEGKALLEWNSFDANHPEELVEFINGLEFSASILSSVRDVPASLPDILSAKGRLVELDDKTPIPLENRYETPETLGKDRLAAAVGGYCQARPNPVLVITAGTCIIYDLVNEKGQYLGGSISPGLTMRLQAMHTFTGRLPLLTPDSDFSWPGKTTTDSMLTGAILGAEAEVQGMIDRYRNQFPGLVTLLSGGDLRFFENQLKSGIFAVPNIVLLGLNEILDYNV